MYIDIQKAFDTVSHTILRYKLEAIGITGDLLNWMISCTSQTRNVCCGVPQGSLLGPRFFSYYVNNLPDAVTEGELATHADDTTLSVVDDNVEVVIDKLNKALASINLWCRNNKLTIHTGKSEAIILTHKPFCGPLKLVMLGNKVLDFATETKCLGIIIDNQLSWPESKSAKKAQVFNKGYRTVYLFYKYYSHCHLLQFSLGYLPTYIIA